MYTVGYSRAIGITHHFKSRGRNIVQGTSYRFLIWGENCPVAPQASLSLQDEEQQEMSASAAFIDQHYGHLVDAVLVKEDLQSAYSQLRVLLDKLSKDAHWVPISWVR